MRRLAAVLLLAIVLTAGARAAITVASTSVVVTTATSAPVVFQIGPGGATTRYFSPLAVSANGTSVAGSLVGRAGADVNVKDALRIANQRNAPQVVTLSATQLSNAQLDVFAWYVYNGATLVATLDMEAASPSVAIALPALATYRIDLRLDLAEGAGLHNAPGTLSFALRVGSGGITLAHAASAPGLNVRTVEVPLRPLMAGSLAGANSTNATASVNAPILLASTQFALYLNNTNASAAWYVKLVGYATSSIGDVSTANVGIENNTGAAPTLVDHVKIASGAVTQAGGSYQRLEPGSTNRLFVRSLEGLLFDGATIDLDVYASDSAAGASYTVSKARVTLT